MLGNYPNIWMELGNPADELTVSSYWDVEGPSAASHTMNKGGESAPPPKK
jgi:hypothetical protein